MDYVGLLHREVDKTLKSGGYLGNIPVLITYFSGDAGALASYDPVTQVVSPNETIGTPLFAVFTQATERQIDNVNVLRDDRFFYISSVALRAAGIIATQMKPNDRVVQDGINYTIVRADPDPSMSLWVIQGRKP